MHIVGGVRVCIIGNMNIMHDIMYSVTYNILYDLMCSIMYDIACKIMYAIMYYIICCATLQAIRARITLYVHIV